MSKQAKSAGHILRPLETEYARLRRVLQIIQLIQHQDGWDVRALARACGVTERTIYRDLTLLQDANIPFFFDEDRRCYRMRQDFFMPPVDLALDEALALVALGEQIAQKEQIPFTLAAARAVAKIRGLLPEKVRRELKAIDQNMAIRLGEAGSGDAVADVFSKVQAAQVQHRCLRCYYESVRSDGFKKSFLLKPYKLFFERRAWYVLGHHGGLDDVRFFKLSRFTELQLTDVSFTTPRNFSIDKHLGNAWRMIRGDRTYKVELVFDAQFAENIADTHWHKTQKVEWEPDGSIRFHCKVDGLDEIQWWVLARGPYCRVIKPRQLIDRVRNLAKKTADQYCPPQKTTCW
ncbi:MAG: WYL domain-containing protein [Phycisphaerales bacterium]|nr:WYL domain-containing protein [Phycisphaerales bacterium]